jgi:hypothetical protein
VEAAAAFGSFLGLGADRLGLLADWLQFRHDRIGIETVNGKSSGEI